MTTTKIHPEGTLLRVTEAHDLGCRPVEKGTEFEVREYMPKLDNPGPGEIPVAFYYGDYNGGMNNVLVDASKVELVKTPEQTRSRRVPTASEIIAELHCMDRYDGFELNEAGRSHGASRELSGVTDDGLPFAFTITVSNIYQADY